MKEEVKLTVGNRTIAGWTDVTITRGCEQIPNSFRIGVTALDPSDGSKVVAYAGQPCEVRVNDDKVITGYIDRDGNGGAARQHRLFIMGRGKCQDLVDCSAEWPSGQLVNGDALQVAKQLAQPYGISVSALNGVDVGKPIPEFQLELTETPVSLIERVTRNAGLLFYEDENGNLVLAQAGQEKHSSGARYGENVLEWDFERSMDQRFSEVVCSLVSLDPLIEAGDAGFRLDMEKDPNVKRHRRLYIVADQSSQGQDLCKRRAIWEVARRAGRGLRVRVRIDSWRDSKGDLWTPNRLMPVRVPGMDAEQTLCISEVTFRLDDREGTTAELLLMPKEAFTPQPIILVPDPVIEAVS